MCFREAVKQFELATEHAPLQAELPIFKQTVQEISGINQQQKNCGSSHRLEQGLPAEVFAASHEHQSESQLDDCSVRAIPPRLP